MNTHDSWRNLTETLQATIPCNTSDSNIPGYADDPSQSQTTACVSGSEYTCLTSLLVTQGPTALEQGWHYAELDKDCKRIQSLAIAASTIKKNLDPKP